MSSGWASIDLGVWWPQCRQVTNSLRTPFWPSLPSVIGLIGYVAPGHRLPTLRGHRRQTAISRHASVLNAIAATSIAELSSLASTLPTHFALEVAR